MVLSSVVMGQFAFRYGIPAPFAVLAGLLCGSICGYINGWLVAAMKLPPFIVTLGMWQIVLATNFLYSANETIRAQEIAEQAPLLHFFGNKVTVGGAIFTYGVIFMVLLVIVLAYCLRHTAWGSHVYAVGDDPEAAALSGVQVRKTLISVYVLSGLICAFAGWALIGRIGSVSPTSGQLANIESITAVVIGGSVQQRLQRSEPEVGRCGHRVGRQRRVTRPRLGVGGHGRADVTPLGVGEHQHPGVAQSADRAFEHREPGRTVGLEERHLRLDHGGGAERGDADVAEASQPVGIDRQTPRLQKLRVRIDAQAQWAALGHRTGKALTEPAHRQDPRALCSSCSDITPMSPRMPASMPCTAAEAPCTVVTQGMFIDTAADRIS